MAVFDEMHGLPEGGAAGDVRPAYRRVAQWLAEAPPDLLDARRRQAELFFRRIGVTFAVYGQAESTERLIPFDIIPRILARTEWAELERGLIQRVQALNAFLADLYGPREILAAGVVPEALILRNPHFRLEMIGVEPPGGVHVHVAGVDVVRTGADGFYVLEDNLRTPSGVSYMLENREMMMRLFPDMFMDHHVAPVEVYPDALLSTLRSVAPAGVSDPCVVVLTPGPFNSAYYEHSFLADKIGVELVEASDLFVRDDLVFMRTTQGPRRVDVVYRRTDDDFLDPLSFRPDSAIGVPGLMSAYRARVTADPSGFIAQPTLALSTCPTLVDEGVAARHVDLRPFVLTGADGVKVVPGGLTRVALTEGSLVVNSSQGGGTKDTWVLDD